MPLSLSALPPAPVWPTQYATDKGCNLRPLRQREGGVTPCCRRFLSEGIGYEYSSFVQGEVVSVGSYLMWGGRHKEEDGDDSSSPTHPSSEITPQPEKVPPYPCFSYTFIPPYKENKFCRLLGIIRGFYGFLHALPLSNTLGINPPQKIILIFLKIKINKAIIVERQFWNLGCFRNELI